MSWNGRVIPVLFFVAAVGFSSAGCSGDPVGAAPKPEESASYAYPGEVCADLDWTVVDQPAAVTNDGESDSYNEKSGHSGVMNCDRRLQTSSDSAIAGSVLLDVKITNDSTDAQRDVEGFVPASPREVTDNVTADFEFAAEAASSYDNARFYVERGDPSLADSWSQGTGIVVQDDNLIAACWFSYTVEPEPANSADLEGRMFKSVVLVLDEIREASKV